MLQGSLILGIPYTQFKVNIFYVDIEIFLIANTRRYVMVSS
jgi:hypothetical protein